MGITERPILFSGEMVRAILDGRKTMTRRVAKISDEFSMVSAISENGGVFAGRYIGDMDHEWFRCPYGTVGDRLYVKETYLNHALEGYPPVYFYKADDAAKPADRKWRSGRFMPKVASRIKLEITGVRVERLQEITWADVIKEGLQVDGGKKDGFNKFKELWDKINGKQYPWALSPWVWVVEFKPIGE